MPCYNKIEGKPIVQTGLILKQRKKEKKNGTKSQG